MRITVTIDDALFERALQVAEPVLKNPILFVKRSRHTCEFSLRNGLRLSGGQRLRCQIYRAVVRSPRSMNDVLVDTSVWVDHFRRESQGLVA